MGVWEEVGEEEHLKETAKKGVPNLRALRVHLPKDLVIMALHAESLPVKLWFCHLCPLSIAD